MRRPPWVFDALAESLATETQLIVEMTTAIRRQRRAAEADDLQGVEDAVFATHRLLLTLVEARRHRRAIHVLLGHEAELTRVRGHDAPETRPMSRVRTAREALQVAARRLFAELAASRHVLRRALADTDLHTHT